MLLYDRLLQVFKAQKEEFMLVYDANANSGSNAGFECTYTTFKSDNSTASPENPILVLDNSEKKWDETSYGLFTNPYKKTAFDFQIDGESFTSNILKIDSRFTSLIKWLGENRVKVKLTGANTSEGYNVYKIQEVAFGNGNKLSAEDGFLQFMIERLLESSAIAEENNEEPDESADDMKLTSLTSISDFLNCAGSTLPENIRLWARRNLVVARSSEVTPEEKRHAQRALSIMLNIKWKSNYFESIDPVEARRILVHIVSKLPLLSPEHAHRSVYYIFQLISIYAILQHLFVILRIYSSFPIEKQTNSFVIIPRYDQNLFQLLNNQKK